ncbi:MAG: hypothetical protein ACKO24_09695 [Leptolyngbyaceae cyanobacterium]
MRQVLIRYTLLTIGIAGLTIDGVVGQPSVSPHPEVDLPEEVLRNQVMTGARSPMDGRPLTASEYVMLQTQIQTPPTQPERVSQKVRDLIGLLKVRKLIKTLIPFFPVK